MMDRCTCRKHKNSFRASWGILPWHGVLGPLPALPRPLVSLLGHNQGLQHEWLITEPWQHGEATPLPQGVALRGLE